ncbi:MAG: hypothetical protein AB7V43_18105, partial [Acidimicrobiia bacterium]
PARSRPQNPEADGGMKRSATMAAVVVVALAGAWYALYWMPRTNEVAEAHQATAAATDALTMVQTQLTNAKKNPVDPSKVAAQLAAARASLPATSDLAGYLEANEAAASAAQVSIVEVTPAKPVGGPVATGTAADESAAGTPSPGADAAAQSASGVDRITTIAVHQVVRGERARLIDYVGRLQSMSRLVVIDAVNLTTEDASTASLTIELRVFSLAP